MSLVPKQVFPAFLRPVCFRVSLRLPRSPIFVLMGLFRSSLDNGRIYQSSLLNDQSTTLELTVQFLKQSLLQSMSNQLFPEAAECRVVGSLFREAEVDKSSKREAVVKRFFESIIGQGIPGLQQKAFEKEEQWVARSTVGRRIHPPELLLERLPVHKAVDFIQTLVQFSVMSEHWI